MISTIILIQAKTFSQTQSESQNKDEQKTKSKYYPSSRDVLKQFKTDVLCSAACSPDHLSFQRVDDGNKQNINVPLRKLSINVNRFSAFRIEGINPLRYSFYSDNQSVAHFTDANDVIVDNFKKDTANIQASSIDILDIFHADSIRTKQVDPTLFKDSIERLKTKIAELNKKWYDTELYIRLLITDKQDIASPKIGSERSKMKKALDSAQNEWRNDGTETSILNQEIVNQTKKFTLYLSSLVINNNVEGIINDIASNSIDTAGYEHSIKKTAVNIKNQSQSTENKIEVINRILQLLQEITSSNPSTSYSSYFGATRG